MGVLASACICSNHRPHGDSGTGYPADLSNFKMCRWDLDAEHFTPENQWLVTILKFICLLKGNLLYRICVVLRFWYLYCKHVKTLFFGWFVNGWHCVPVCVFSLKRHKRDCMFPQASTPPLVFGEVEVTHPSGTRLQSAHNTGTAQQGPSTHQGVVVYGANTDLDAAAGLSFLNSSTTSYLFLALNSGLYYYS